MQTIRISKQCFEQVSDRNVDYFIREMLGMVDYNITSSIKAFPSISDIEKKDITIEDDTYDELRKNFKSAGAIDDIVETLIWAYLFVGSNL